ncbi:MAG: DUF3795 domain-containing protein [Prolixibacteraceae bacterium]|nr:DUF3795 domain-containing protein [Prolixibacteraceae bacterium]
MNNNLFKIAAGCGLHCATCTFYIGSTEDRERSEKHAKRFEVPIEAVTCYGCKSEKHSAYCQSCKLIQCLNNKGLDYCGECSEYPCQALKDFKMERPHRNDLFIDMQLLMEKGLDEWNELVRRKYTCPECGTLNSAYDLVCRKCGNKPSSEFVKQNTVAIMKALGLSN